MEIVFSKQNTIFDPLKLNIPYFKVQCGLSQFLAHIFGLIKSDYKD